MAGQTNSKPAILIKRIGRTERTHYHGTERRADLSRWQVRGQILPQRHCSKVMERAAAIGIRASECRVASVRRDQTLLHGRVAPGAFQDPLAQLFPTGVNWLNKIEHGDEQGVDDEAVVIVPMKIKSVSVCTSPLYHASCARIASLIGCRRHSAPTLARNASIIAEKSSQLLCAGSNFRVL